MIIDDQIRDEKLQNDITREFAKILALSSGKINKYEYLTGEKILPSNIIHLIILLAKLLKKQIKTTEDQEERQIKAIQNQREIKTVKKYAYSVKDSPLISK